MLIKLENLRITHIEESVSGFSRLGIPYCHQTIIACDRDGINYCFTLWNSLANLPFSLNDIVSISFIIKCDRYKKRWYTELTAKKIIAVETKFNYYETTE